MAQPTKEADAPKMAISPEALEMLKIFAAELKKPSADEQRKLDEEKVRREAEVRAQIEEAKQFDAIQEATQANCPHHNGKKHTWNGQVTTNGDARAFCSRCGKDYAWSADMETIRAGVLSLGEINWLTEKHLMEYEKKAPPKIIANRLKRKSIAGVAV